MEYATANPSVVATLISRDEPARSPQPNAEAI
jgi:hypothetical protein